MRGRARARGRGTVTGRSFMSERHETGIITDNYY